MGGLLVIQARMGSSRLPGKVLADISGRSMLRMVVDRASRASAISDVVVATTVDPIDDHLAAAALELGAGVVRGDAFDVLSRFGLALDAHPHADPIVRVTADCPFVDPEVIDRLVRLQAEGDTDFVANRLPPPWRRTVPVGLDVEVASRRALCRAIDEAKESHDREHVMPYIYRHPNMFSIVIDESDADLSHFRWTVDTEKDLEAVREIARRVGPEPFGWTDVLRVALENPWIAKINADVQQKSVNDVDARWDRPV